MKYSQAFEVVTSSCRLQKTQTKFLNQAKLHSRNFTNASRLIRFNKQILKHVICRQLRMRAAAATTKAIINLPEARQRARMWVWRERNAWRARSRTIAKLSE